MKLCQHYNLHQIGHPAEGLQSDRERVEGRAAECEERCACAEYGRPAIRAPRFLAVDEETSDAERDREQQR